MQPADRGHARVVADLEQRAAGLVLRLELGLPLGRVHVHRAELEHPELLLAEADPPVRVEHGAAGAELDRDRDRDPERQPEDDHGARDEEVERPLDHPVGADEHRRPQLEERRALARNELGALDEQVGGLRRDPHLDPGAVRQIDDVEELPVGEVRVGDDQLVHVVVGQDRAEVVRSRRARAGRSRPATRRSRRRTRSRCRSAPGRACGRGGRGGRPRRRGRRGGGRRARAAPRV